MSSNSTNGHESENVISGEQKSTNTANTNNKVESKDTIKNESESLILNSFSLYETKTVIV